MICIIDYGIRNIGSIQNIIKRVDKLLLVGVAYFDHAIKKLLINLGKTKIFILMKK